MRKILLTSCLLLCGAVLAWAQPAASYPLGKVEFVGLKKYDRQQALTASELKTGQSVTLAALDAAAKKLAALGYFRRVNYRYQLNNNKLDVVFEVEEAGGAVPCVFDNFAGFTDRELVEEVRQKSVTVCKKSKSRLSGYCKNADCRGRSNICFRSAAKGSIARNTFSRSKTCI
jgi:outer membrane protein assembly factor BamA